MRSFLCIFLLLIATSIEARMYQWVNPTTGRSQLSGKAPAWYRSEVGGPRVLVFEKNVLVDDTAVAVDEEQRLQLRDKALLLLPEEKELTAAQAVATLEEQIQAIVESPAMEEYLKNPPAASATQNTVQTDQTSNTKTFSRETANQDQQGETDKPVRESADERVERLKALISVWDENRTEEAKSLLEPETDQKDSAEEK